LGDSSRVGLGGLESEDTDRLLVESSGGDGAGELESEDIDGHVVGSSGVGVGEIGSGDIDARGLIWGVWSERRRRDGVLKLKLMLKMSLGRGHNLDAHKGLSFLTLVFVAVGFDVALIVVMLFDLGALGIVDACGTSS
jgi:hypothetical protein